MATDWHATLTEEGQVANSKAVEVTIMIGKLDLTAEAASILYRDVEKHAQRFDKLFERMEDDLDLDSPLVEAGERLQDMWADLSMITVNKLREIQGLRPISVPADDEDD